MSDIEYTIRRFKYGEFTEAVRFTESELRAKFNRIAKLIKQGMDLTIDCDFQYALDILLRGEGEKGEEPQCHTCEYKVGYPTKDGWCYMFKSKIPDCKKYILQKDQPSHAPTREEWEAWASDLAVRLFDVDYSSKKVKLDDIVDCILSMPIIPKE